MNDKTRSEHAANRALAIVDDTASAHGTPRTKLNNDTLQTIARAENNAQRTERLRVAYAARRNPQPLPDFHPTRNRWARRLQALGGIVSFAVMAVRHVATGR